MGTIEQPVGLVPENLRRLPAPLEKYIVLEGLHDRNETLCFRAIVDHPDGIVPLVYTPTVGAATRAPAADLLAAADPPEEELAQELGDGLHQLAESGRTIRRLDQRGGGG